MDPRRPMRPNFSDPMIIPRVKQVNNTILFEKSFYIGFAHTVVEIYG